MNVAIVVQNDFPNVGEVRPTRLGKSLSDHGHRVHILASNPRKEPFLEDLSYARVHRFRYFKNFSPSKLLNIPSPLNLFWLIWICEVIAKQKIDIVISSNIRVALPAILAARLMGKPVVLDLQENNEELVRHRPKTRFYHHLSRNPYLVRALEHLCARGAHSVWVVIEERLQSLPPDIKRKRKVLVIKHTPNLEEVRPSKGAKLARMRSGFLMMYVGRFQGGFGRIELILQAMPRILSRDRTVQFVIGGVETRRSELEDIVLALNIKNNVHIHGKIEPEDIPDWLIQGDIGVLPYPVNLSTSTTISNKVFHYMAAGLPVLTTDMPPTRRIIEEFQCGRVIPSGSRPQDVANIILQMKENPKELRRMGENGIRAVIEKYNWNCDFHKALRCIEELAFSKG